MMPLSNSEIARRNADTLARFGTKTPGHRSPPVLHTVAYTGGHEIHYTGRPEDRTDETPCNAVTSLGQILTSGTYAECELALAAKGCRRMAS